MITYIDKDITTVEQGIIAHGVNCSGVLNSGVAKAIRTKWPIIYDEYMECPKGKDMLGTIHRVYINDNLYIINCYTQEFFGRDGKIYADKDSVFNCLEEAANIAHIHNLPLYIPKIGCGLGGLDWETEVSQIIIVIDNMYKIDRSGITEIKTLNNEVDIYVCEFGE